MKQTPDEVRTGLTCAVCSYWAATFPGLGAHVVKGHRIGMREYYERYVHHPCGCCGKQVPFGSDSYDAFNRRFCSRKCAARVVMPTYLGPMGKGSVSGDGYRVVEISKYPGHEPILAPMAMSKRQILEHRAVMAISIGRPLTKRESVHHKDGNRLNNSIENLELWAKPTHTPGVRASELKCPHCGKHYV